MSIQIPIPESERGWYHSNQFGEVLSNGPFPTREECIADGRAFYDRDDAFCIFEIQDSWTLRAPSYPWYELTDDLAEAIEIEIDEPEADRRFKELLESLIDEGVIRFSTWQADNQGELIKPLDHGEDHESGNPT